MKRYPDGHVLYRNLQKSYPVVTHGQGIYLYDQDGRQYIDGSGGAYVTSLGHSNTEIVNRIAEQLNRVAYVNGMHMTSDPLEKLTEKIYELSKKRFGRSFLLSSGSEAIEAAIKLVRQVWVARGQPGKFKILTRDPSYHGNTLFALSMSARKSYKAMYGPLLNPSYTVETPYPYRCPVDYEKDGADYYAKQFEALILKEDPATIAAIMLEPISGSSAGGSCPPKHYLEKVQAIAHRHNILLIADEVLVGSGRTGEFFASDHYNFHPDVLVLGKSINGGYIPASLVALREELLTDIARAGQFLHAQTYMHHPAAAACCLAVIQQIEQKNLLDNVTRMGRLMHEQLQSGLGAHPHVGHIAGKGLLAGVEFVQDRAKKEPFHRQYQVAEKFREWAFAQGLIVWFQSGQWPDGRGDIALLAPAFNIKPEEVGQLTSKFKRAVESFFQDFHQSQHESK